MSSPVEIVKEMYAAFARGDIDGVLTHLAGDVLWSAEGPPSMGFTGVRHGKQETLEGFFGGIAQEHADPQLRMTEFVAQDDSVAAFGRYEATLKRTGQRVSSPVGHLFKFRNGQVVHYINLLDTAAFVRPPQGPAAGVAVSYTPAKMAASQYDQIIRRLSATTVFPPPGALMHACYGPPDQLCVFDVFDSMESFQAFSKILSPLIAEAGVDPGTPDIRPLYALGSR